jgi:hypothetical protein
VQAPLRTTKARRRRRIPGEVKPAPMPNRGTQRAMGR